MTMTEMFCRLAILSIAVKDKALGLFCLKVYLQFEKGNDI